MSADLQARLKKYRLSVSEYERIQKLLGRDPEGVEWALFSALWSEHCSYKSSRIHLKKFAFKSPRVLQAMGENAGVIDLGQGEKVAFKMESHNHPSFIEPYQGAATGVGGILRDIFTMGARPVALANYLCFGRPQAPRMQTIVEGVVAGISGYGNCVGVPTITGQTEFDESYDNNVLVNALAVGLFRKEDPVVTSQASGVGNWVVYVGAKTGRDGVHGASMASESFAADSASKRPTVQIGDPFFEKLLIESCLDVMKQNLVVAIQDMGAAGLTSSCFEMAAKGGVGFKIHLDQVPLRDSTIGPEEILLSESQERMLLVCEPSKFAAIQKVFHHWGLDASKLGEVVAGKDVELVWHNETLCKIDPNMLVDNAPMYDRPFDKWTPKFKADQLEDVPYALTETVGSVEACGREWIYRQYDQRVGAKTVRDCEESVACVRLPDSGRGLGLTLGCRPYLMRLDAAIGGADAGLYPALELSIKGFQPLAMTDCLNFGNPERKHIMSEFVASVEALAHVSKTIDAPVISGNVSFYNETLATNITSTPATGLVGIRDTVDHIPRGHFTTVGDQVWLVRTKNPVALNAGHFGLTKKFTGSLDVQAVAHFMEGFRKVANDPACASTRVAGKFGIGYALFRMCKEGVGAEVVKGDWAKTPNPWSDEHLYEVLVAGQDALEASLKKIPHAEVFKLGRVIKGDLMVDGGKQNLSEWHERYNKGWREHFPAHYS